MVNKQGDAIDLIGLFLGYSLPSRMKSVLADIDGEAKSALVRWVFGQNNRVAMAVKTTARYIQRQDYEVWRL